MKTQFSEVEKMFRERGYGEFATPYWVHRTFEFKKLGEGIFKHYPCENNTKNDIRDIASKIELV